MGRKNPDYADFDKENFQDLHAGNGPSNERAASELYSGAKSDKVRTHDSFIGNAAYDGDDSVATNLGNY